LDGLTGTKAGSGVWQRIISEMPEHEVYMEPFWGRGCIAKRKRPARWTIGVDLDPAAVASGVGSALMFLGDGVRFVADYFRLGWLLDPMTDDGEAAAYAASYGDVLPAAAGDAESSVAVRDAECDAAAGGACTFGGASWRRHFVYLDPPYPGCSGYYRFDLTEERHRILCRLFRRLPCAAALSGYRSAVYDEELAGVRRIEIPTVNRAGRAVTEVLWMNYDPPRRHHDLRFTGADRRERERIRRRCRTWSDGLRRMKPAERQAVFDSCAATIINPNE
jgi:hypothetical protein